jgi:AraC-like DNA-binding protein
MTIESPSFLDFSADWSGKDRSANIVSIPSYRSRLGSAATIQSTVKPRGPIVDVHPKTWEDFLRESALSRQVIDDFLTAPGWARFDSELGYLLGDSAIDWGLDGTRTIETLESDGARSAVRYPGIRPRINCYGDAFTEGTQVSDGETWEEYLAGHLGEPVGNYGVGVYGVYQAYRRMKRQESMSHGASVVILYILNCTMVLGVTRSPWFALSAQWRSYAEPRHAFHGNPWPTMEIDLESGRFVERENPLRAPASLYKLCDPEWLVSELGDDLGGQLLAFGSGSFDQLDVEKVTRLAEILDTPFNWDSEDLRAEAAALLDTYGQRAAIEVVDLATAFLVSTGKRLLVALNHSRGPVYDPALTDELLVEHLHERGIAVFDMNLVHFAEHERTSVTYDDYMSQYQAVGVPPGVVHPNARGNHLFAYAIKDSVVPLLDQKPTPYRKLSSVGRSSIHAELRPVGNLGEDARWLEPMLTELQTRFAEPWGAASLAQLARKSRSSLYSDFLAVMKMTPMEYVKQLRLDEAARLLRDTDSMVAGVASRVGFSSPYHFSREFTRRFGTAPSRYRREQLLETG